MKTQGKNKNEDIKPTLVEFVESRLGKDLSSEEKNTILECKELFDMANSKSKTQVEPRAKVITFPYFLRYVAVAVITLVLCLSVFLPITLRDSTTMNQEPPPTEREVFTEEDVNHFPITPYRLRSVNGLLMFEESKMPLWNDASNLSRVEFAKEPPIMLGYFIEPTFLMFENGDIFSMTFRIRTYRYYHFAGHLENHFSALELAREKSTNAKEQTIFIISEEHEYFAEPRKTKVNTFVVDDTKVFSYIRSDYVTGIITAVIHFSYGGNDYFIELTDMNIDNQLTLNYLETVFMRTLIDSDRTGA